MKEINVDQAISILNDILEYELAGVVKYTHFALMVTGPNRLTLDKFFKSQATESLEHAQVSKQERAFNRFRRTSFTKNTKY